MTPALKDRVMVAGDETWIATVVTPGAEVSTVRLDDGGERNFPNDLLAPAPAPSDPNTAAATSTVQPAAPPAPHNLETDMRSQIYSVRSNARRAAKAAGLDPEIVTPVRGGFVFDDGKKAPAEKPAKAAKPAKAKAAAKAKAKTAPKAKAARTPRAATGERGDGQAKAATVLAMITQPGGAPITDICKATGWLAHTARARISGIVKANKLDVERTRLLGVSIYQAKPKAKAA